MVTVSLRPLLVNLGLPYAMVRFLAVETDRRRIQEGLYSILAVSLLTGGLTAIVLFALAGPIASGIFGGMTDVARITALVVLVECINLVSYNYFRTFQKIRRYSILLFSQTYLLITLLAITVLSGYGIIGAMLSLLASRVVLLVVMLALIARDIGFAVPAFSRLREYLGFGVPTIPSNLSSWIVSSSDRYMIGILVGIAAIISLLALDALLLSYLRPSQVDLLFFIFALLVVLSLPVLTLLGYLVYALLNMRYHLHRDALTIVWGATQQIIPMSSIHKVVRGEDLEEEIRMRGVSWPGYLMGRGYVEGVGRTLFYATEPVARQLLVVTPTVAYGVSPADLDGFLDALEIRQHMGPMRLVSHEHRQPGFLSWPVWRDRLALQLLAVGLGASLTFLAYLCWRTSSRAEIFRLLAIGLVTLIVNSSMGILIHSRQRAGAYLLWGGAIAVQFLSWLVVVSIVQ